MEECIFCKIVQGEIPCAKVYEDDTILSFLDIGPIQEGHTLVIPKEHYPSLLDVPDSLGSGLLQVLKSVGRAVMDATQAQGLNVIMNNFPAAGQIVPHAHWHLIPRYAKDGLKFWPQKSYTSNEDMLELAEKIKDKLT